MDTLFEKAGKRYGVDPDFLRAVAWVESGFNAKAVSPKGAIGIMQLMAETAKSHGVSDPFDPAQNIDGGARYLRELLDAYGGDVELALVAYNAGPGVVERYNGVPPYPETQNYVAAVKRAYHVFKEAEAVPGGRGTGGGTGEH
ncbi:MULTISPECIES: lytic transglycosylase domain-containing protein [unclassified Neomoorella]|uniref:lytic transglycosylase domain-containing protein n=1 Tax=unclassified Neomoorella TaxID=2676739 RepID=UPI00241462D3|nr:MULTISPECIES: lytic transglycosylase domain-containing protein [unclassified Moorella (in: firmicutes)]